MNGTIKTLVRAKGFGFISREGETKDLFFHSTELKGVTYDELKKAITSLSKLPKATKAQPPQT